MIIKYRVHLSNKTSVLIDVENYGKLLENISSNFVILNGEVVNPSFIVSIIKENCWDDEPTMFRASKPNMKLVGHIDEETRTYIIDGEEEIK